MKKTPSITVTLVLILSLILSACSNPSQNTSSGSGDKQDFIIKAAPVASFSMQWWFTKQGIVSATEEVTLSSQVAGRVTQIPAKVGKKVGVGQLLLSLEDINGTITFATKKAAVWVESARDTYNQNKLNLDKSLFDTQIAYERNSISSLTSIEDIKKQQEKINKDLRDNDLSYSGSTLSLQLQKLAKDLEKAELDYQTKLDSDNQTILNFFNSVKLIWSDLSNLFQDSINLSDELLWVTTTNRNKNDSFEYVLGNKDMTSKQIADAKLSDTILAYEKFKMLVNDVNINTISGLLLSYSQWVDSINSMLASINTMLINTEPGGPFSTTMYTTYKAQFDGYKSKASWLGTSITSQLNGINSFFAVYKQTQDSLAKWIDSLKQQIELSKKSINDAQFNIQLWSDRQLLWLDATLKNQELSNKSAQFLLDYAARNNNLALEALWNALDSAQIIYEEANFSRGKFTVEAPIPWTITDIYVDRWQEVNLWTPLFTVVNTNLKQVDITVTDGERELIVPGQVVTIKKWAIIWKGIVESVSEVADRNFSYKVVVTVSEWNFPIWSSVTVEFAGSVGENIIIPLNAVSIVDNGRWVVNIFRNGEIVSSPVGLGAMAGQYVIVTDGLAVDDMIVTSDVTNFDPEKMEVRVK